VRIRPATPADTDAVFVLLDAAVAWLVDIGREDQWGTRPWSEIPSAAERVASRIAAGQLYLAVSEGEGGELLGMIAYEPEPPAYIAGLPVEHHLRRKENVFLFSVAAASAQLNQFITMITAPSGVADTGAHLFHLATGTVDRIEDGCTPGCRYASDLLLLGDVAPPVTGRDLAAENARAYRQQDTD